MKSSISVYKIKINKLLQLGSLYYQVGSVSPEKVVALFFDKNGANIETEKGYYSLTIEELKSEFNLREGFDGTWLNVIDI